MARQRGGGRQVHRSVIEAGRFLGYGLTWTLSTMLFLFLGWLLDRWLGTLPLFVILGAVVGAGAGFYSLYFHLIIEPRQRQQPPHDEGAGGI